MNSPRRSEEQRADKTAQSMEASGRVGCGARGTACVTTPRGPNRRNPRAAAGRRRRRQAPGPRAETCSRRPPASSPLSPACDQPFPRPLVYSLPLSPPAALTAPRAPPDTHTLPAARHPASPAPHPRLYSPPAPRGSDQHAHAPLRPPLPPLRVVPPPNSPRKSVAFPSLSPIWRCVLNVRDLCRSISRGELARLRGDVGERRDEPDNVDEGPPRRRLGVRH